MHTFHIPVLGLSYSIDTPLKVARYGISSVVSIIEDELIEKMRAYHCLKSGEPYTAITTREDDFRAKRITAYLDLLNRLVGYQTEALRKLPFGEANDLACYFDMLPDSAKEKQLYESMLIMPGGEQKSAAQRQLKDSIRIGAIDVNIMAKVDALPHHPDGTPLPPEYADAMSALRGFANSSLSSSVVMSAGYNPRLYNYFERFGDFFPDASGELKKRVILKVSDYRSALVQGKILAKKGIWVSEFRIESGLNCGGHAFATDGYLLGPILQEFRDKRMELTQELWQICDAANEARGGNSFPSRPIQRITVQGGIGTAGEDEFLRSYYQLDGTGWGSPFLLVPGVTNVDPQTLEQLACAVPEDYFLSDASPLGVPFHNFRKSTGEVQRANRIAKNRPGSPCYKKFLATDTEFTTTPICTASRQYQNLKIGQLRESGLVGDELEKAIASVTVKDCLCEGLSAAVLIKDDIHISHNLSAVTICPGPNLAFFSGTFTLQEMAGHIYGRGNILNEVSRPHMFVNELKLYVDYLKKQAEKYADQQTKKQRQFLLTFRANLLNGIEYYKALLPELKKEKDLLVLSMKEQLNSFQHTLNDMILQSEPTLLPDQVC